MIKEDLKLAKEERQRLKRHFTRANGRHGQRLIRRISRLDGKMPAVMKNGLI
jgi:hypothetical protein